MQYLWTSMLDIVGTIVEVIVSLWLHWHVGSHNTAHLESLAPEFILQWALTVFESTEQSEYAEKEEDDGTENYRQNGNCG